MAATVVVAADVGDLRPERVAEETEIAGLEVATADDRVDPADRLAVDRVVERVVDIVGDREQPDRGAVAALERLGVRPHDGQASGHPSPPASGGAGARRVLARQFEARPLAAAGRPDRA